MTDQLISTKEIAQLLGVCQRHATAAITKRPDFHTIAGAGDCTGPEACAGRLHAELSGTII